MKEKMKKCILAFGIIALFIGMAVVPAGAGITNPVSKNVEQYQTTEAKSAPVTHHWKIAYVFCDFQAGTFNEDHKALLFHHNVSVDGTAIGLFINKYNAFADVQLTMTKFIGIVYDPFGDVAMRLIGIAFNVTLTEL